MNVTRRPIQDADHPFLLELYAGTRSEELARTGWSREQQDAFLRMQFEAQHRHYTTEFAGAAFDLVLGDGEPIGRLYVDRRAEEIRLLDIALVSSQRGRGIGSGLMRELIAEAARTGHSVGLHVEIENERAHALYRRLGFEDGEIAGIHRFMRWSPSAEE